MVVSNGTRNCKPALRACAVRTGSCGQCLDAGGFTQKLSFSDDMASDVLFISIGECPLNNLSPKRLMSAFAGGRSVGRNRPICRPQGHLLLLCLSRGGGGWRPKKTVQNCSACVRGPQSHWSRGALHETLWQEIDGKDT